MSDRDGEPRGRGAGINKPAWMVAREREEREKGVTGSGVGGDGDRGNGGRGDDRGGGSGYGDRDDRYSDPSDGRHSDRDRDRNRSVDRDQFGRIGRDGGGDPRDRDYRDDRRSRDDWRGDREKRDRGRRSRDERRGDRGRRERGGGGGNRSGIYFHSYGEERAWLEDRRRKRRARKSLFDVEPTPEQAAMDEARAALERDHLLRTGGVAAAAVTFVKSSSGDRDDRGGGSVRALQPQQTRHARRLYVGNIPDLSEQEVHDFFRDAIRTALVVDPNSGNSSHRSQYVESDPIISVYINRERRFAFLEFKTMEICTACLAFDGIDVMGRGKVKVKRPNDYNPALAPTTNPASLPQLDISRLGIVSPSVPDGPNKIFIGGLPYHLTENQVLELLGAFGRVRAFHLVKSDTASVTSKGYCFVEYSDPNVTQIAVMGLNGMDMGGGKQLSARMAASRGVGDDNMMDFSTAGMGAPVAAAPAGTVPGVVDGVDVDALLQAALGGGSGGGGVATMSMAGAIPAANMGPMGSMMLQQPVANLGGISQFAMNTMGVMQQGIVPQQHQPVVVTDPLAVANAAASALDAAFGSGATALTQPMHVPVAMPGQHAPMGMSMGFTPQAPSGAGGMTPTRILVLLNIVMDEDLATDEDHAMLEVEVREEAGKYGKLLSMKIPRPQVCFLLLNIVLVPLC